MPFSICAVKYMKTQNAIFRNDKGIDFMKKILAFLLILTVVFTVPLSAFASSDVWTVDAKGAVLYNLNTGTTVFSKEADTPMVPASTTKIMTAIVVLENCPEPKTATVTVPDSAMFSDIIRVGGAHMALRSGETVSVYDLLVGMMIGSYCDAAEMLAYEFGGKDVSTFIKKMNDKGESLGLSDTCFCNAHGLTDPGHHSTPADITKIMAYAIQDPLFLEILRIRTYTIPKTNRSSARTVRHTVPAFSPSDRYYDDCYVGGKSGYTKKAGRCLVTYAEKDGVSYILTLLGANLDTDTVYTEKNTTYRDTHQVLTDAYRKFGVVPVFKAGERVTSVSVEGTDKKLDVVAKTDIAALVPNGEPPAYDLSLPASVPETAVTDQAEIGTLHLRFNGDPCGTACPLLLSWDGTPLREEKQTSADAGISSLLAAVIAIPVAAGAVFLIFGGKGKKKR